MSSFIRKVLFDIIGVAAGIISVVLSFIVFGMNTGVYELAAKYGGDAYTGIQNASAQTANNIIYLSKILQQGLGGILLVGGLALIACFGKKVFDAYNDEKQSFTAMVSTNDIKENINPIEIQGEISTEE